MTSPPDTLILLLDDAQTASDVGNKYRAHRLLRRAATLYPGYEVVWHRLLQVVEQDPDRLVCLHNIAVINPKHDDIKRQLASYRQETRPTQLRPLRSRPYMVWLALPLRLLLVLVEVLVMAFGLSIVFILIWYI